MILFEGNFWKKVDRRSDDECWNWKACIDSRGYGSIRIKKKLLRAHRVAWEIAFGGIPVGMSILHRCDNRICCNPKHLFSGTQVDNIHDMMSKGRHNAAKGETHPMAKLRNADVLRMRKSNLRHTELIKKYKVSASTIRRIRIGKLWKHLGGNRKINARGRARGEEVWTARLTEKQVRDILCSNKCSSDLARYYSVHRNVIYRIRKRQTWRHVEL